MFCRAAAKEVLVLVRVEGGREWVWRGSGEAKMRMESMEVA